MMRSYRRAGSVLLGLSLLTMAGGALAGAGGAEGEPDSRAAVAKAAAALYEGIRTETLANGLRVYLKPIPNSPVVTTMVAYKVGSADENLDFTGLSHYLEHLMFKGTDKIHPGDIDHITLQNGGSNNAYTSEDYTIYHFDFAREQWEVPLRIEADRMRNLRIDVQHEFELEKGAVCAELDRDEDEPWDLEQKAILPLLFGKTAPYGHPVIGEKEHVHRATAEIIKAHYDTWYHPNNAALVVVGGFEPDVVLKKIEELFGPIPRQPLPERKASTAVKRQGPASKEFPSKFDVPRMLMGYNTVRIGEPDYYPLEVVEALLSRGKTSRLYKKLIEGEEIASTAEASDNAGRYPGWFGIQVELIKGKSRARAEELVLAELQRLRDEPPTDTELKRVKQEIVAARIMGRESPHNLADSIARGVTNNDLEFLKSYLSRIEAVTAADVQRVAKKYLDPEQRVVVWSVPSEEKAGGNGEARPKTPPERKRQAAQAGGEAFSLRSAKRVELPNGLVLVLLENRRLPIVVADVYIRNVDLAEPEDKPGVATLMGRMLDEGTSKHTGPEIAELIENVGGVLTMTANGGSVQVLSPDRELALRLLFECLREPSFPQDAFHREQQQMLSEIGDLQTKPMERAEAVYHQLAYGKHPKGRSLLGKEKEVAKLTPEDCRDFHRRLFLPNNAIVTVVGDFDTQQVIEEVTKLTADWKKSEPPALKLPEVAMPAQFRTEVLTMPGAAQLQFFMGHPGIRFRSPDYYKLLVMDYVLGTGPGFTDRLSARLRDREGLAYTVSANITHSATEEPGLFTCYIGTEPKNFAKVKEQFLEELNRIRSEAPTKEEVEDAKKYLLGRLPFQFVTNGEIASQLLKIERYHLGFNYLDDFRKAVAAVTPDDVRAVAEKYIHPQNMVLVVAGAVDKDGNLLAAEKAGRDK